MVEVKGESTEVFFMDQKEWLEKAINKDNF